MKYKDDIGSLIAKARKKKDITQAELAAKLNVSDKAISNWETGKNLPDMELVPNIEKILDIEVVCKEQENKIVKMNKILIIILIIMLCFLIPLSLYFMINYNKYRIYEVTLESDNYEIENSYLIIFRNKIVLDLNEIYEMEVRAGYNYDVSLYYNDEVITKKDSYNGLTYELSKSVLKHLDELYLKVEYYDMEDNKQEDVVYLNFTKMVSNNKIFYVNEKKTKVINTTSVLLVNNNYLEIEDDIYQKESKDILYTYYLNKNKLYMEYCKNDVCIYASKIGTSSCYYMAFKNDKVIEYRLSISQGTANFEYYDEVSSLIDNEYSKLN